MDIDRLNNLSKIYKDQLDLIARLDKVLDEFIDKKDNYRRLIKYYYSEDFIKEMDESNREDLDSSVDQTILSEDAIYDLMTEHYDLTLKLLNTANDIFQDRDI
ncbi:MAG: DUF4298 domain-containing protein [Anaerococcus sp.]|nr:DUF4298 domain-containing protein [Anaerococcus sp.]